MKGINDGIQVRVGVIWKTLKSPEERKIDENASPGNRDGRPV